MSFQGLSGVSETLLIPLAARATARELNPDLGFDDRFAREAVESIGFDPRRFSHDWLTMRAATVRAKVLDEIARGFLGRHGNAFGISLAAGLDARFQRVDDGQCEWVDVDLEPVIALKRQLVHATDRYRQVVASLTEPGWVDATGWHAGRPTIVFAEGVLPYLAPADVAVFFARAAERFPTGTELAFDFVHPLATRLSGLHPSIGRTSARCNWGIRDAEVVTRWAPPWRMVSVTGIVEGCGGIVGKLARVGRRLGHPFYSIAHFRRT